MTNAVLVKMMRNRHPRKWISKDMYVLEGIRRFGNDPLNWKFICPICSHVASVQDFLNVGAPEGMIGIACIGAVKRPQQVFNPTNGTGRGPCNYTGRGKFDFNPLEVQDLGHFQDFAPREIS